MSGVPASNEIAGGSGPSTSSAQPSTSAMAPPSAAPLNVQTAQQSTSGASTAGPSSHPGPSSHSDGGHRYAPYPYPGGKHAPPPGLTLQPPPRMMMPPPPWGQGTPNDASEASASASATNTAHYGPGPIPPSGGSTYPPPHHQQLPPGMYNPNAPQGYGGWPPPPPRFSMGPPLAPPQPSQLPPSSSGTATSSASQQYPPGYGGPPLPHNYPTDWNRMPPPGVPGAPGFPPQLQQQQQQPQGAPRTPSQANLQAAAQALQSPGACSVGPDDSLDDTKSIRSTGSAPPPHTPARTGTATPSTAATSTSKSKGPSRQEVLEKMVATAQILPQHIVMERRSFFEQILNMAEQAGEPLSGPPQVSKAAIDLHRLYKAVRSKGGFEQVTKDKVWKHLCTEANPEMSESSAAGYQLRRHYQKHLLPLECIETGRNAEELVAFAERQKKKKKDRDPHGNNAAANNATGNNATSATASAPSNQGPPPQGPTGFAPHPHVPPTGPGQQGPPPPFHVDANGQPMPHFPNAPYGFAPPGWGQMPPPGYPHYQPRFMHPMGGAPPRPPGDQAAFEEQQKQMMMQQQQAVAMAQQQQQQQQAQAQQAAQQPRPVSRTASTAPTPQPPQSHSSAVPGPSTPAAVAAAAASRAPSAAPTPAMPTASASESATTANETQQHPQFAGLPPSSSMAAPQMGQPPMQFYQGAPPMGMYGQRMPYPQQQQQPGPPPNGFQPPGSETGPQPGQQPPQGFPGAPAGMYPTGNPTAWGQQMMRPQGFPGAPPPPGQPGAEYWQQQQQQAQHQRAAVAAAQAAGRRPPFFPNHPGSQLSPRPSVPPTSAAAPSMPAPSTTMTPQPPPNQVMMPQPGPQQPGVSQASIPPQMLPPSSANRPRPSMPGVAGPPVQFQPQPAMQQHHAMIQPPVLPQPIQFPPGSVEAISSTHLGPQRRPAKKYTKDLLFVSSRRILMALRSDLYMENVWALNALTVMLYDDSINPPTLNPELLHTIMEHFRAALALLFPKVFPVNGTDDLPDEIRYISAEQAHAAAMALADRDYWTTAVNQAADDGEDLKTDLKMVFAPSMRGPTKPTGADFNKKSRTGLKVVSKNEHKPIHLVKWVPNTQIGICNSDDEDDHLTHTERHRLGLPNGLTARVAKATHTFVLQATFESEKVKFSRWDKRDKTLAFCDEVQPKSNRIYDGIDERRENNSDEIDDESSSSETKPNAKKTYDREAPLDCSLVPRPIGLFLVPKKLRQYADIVLAWSNILRGFAFNPANESLLAGHNGLLRLIGRLLMLYVEEGDAPQQQSRRQKQEQDAREGKTGMEETTLEQDAITKAEDEKKRAAMVSNEKDEVRSFMLEVANQLRDDAFTELSFIAGSLDLFELDSTITYPIFDALLHWTVSHSVLAIDPLTTWGLISPRNFCLEIICKMSVIDRNVDMLLSTGSWTRIEEFIRIVAGLLHMGEDAHVREFALVIMNALCQASEEVCIVAANETPVIKNVVGFLEATDAALIQVMTEQGIEFIKHNPEAMGTSIGMLRRAVFLLHHIVIYESCRTPFLKFTTNLINLTFSSYMDTRAAAMITSLLHYCQLCNIDETGKVMDVPETPSVEPRLLFPGKFDHNAPKRENNDDGSGVIETKSEPLISSAPEKSVIPAKSVSDTDVKPTTNGITSLIKNEINAVSVAKPLSPIQLDVPRDSAPPTAFASPVVLATLNGTEQELTNGIHSNGHHKPMLNGVYKRKLSATSPSKDVKALLRDSINSKQHDDAATTGGTMPKKQRVEVNGSSNGVRINGTSSSNTAPASSSASSSTMAIVT